MKTAIICLVLLLMLAACSNEGQDVESSRNNTANDRENSLAQPTEEVRAEQQATVAPTTVPCQTMRFALRIQEVFVKDAEEADGYSFIGGDEVFLDYSLGGASTVNSPATQKTWSADAYTNDRFNNLQNITRDYACGENAVITMTLFEDDGMMGGMIQLASPFSAVVSLTDEVESKSGLTAIFTGSYDSSFDYRIMYAYTVERNPTTPLPSESTSTTSSTGAANPVTTSGCGDGYCDFGETSLSCSADCGSETTPITVGDGICGIGEDLYNSTDCITNDSYAAPPQYQPDVIGDGQCGLTENSAVSSDC